MRRSLILLLAVAALAAPSAALAADPAAPAPAVPATAAATYFEIRAITVDGRTLEVAGKGFIENGTLQLSVGCNAIGGDVRVDGDQLILGSIATTEMACGEPMDSAEAALVRFLGGGVITMAPDGWTSAAGSISLVVVSVDPVPVPSDDPGGVVVSPPDPGFSLQDCVGILPADEFPSLDGTSGSGSASGSGGGGTDGSTGSGVAEPGATAVTVEPAEPPVTAPDATTAVDPATEPQPMPAETANDLPLPVDVVPMPVDPGVVVVEPTPVPGGGTVPTIEQCRELVAQIRTLGPVAGDGTAAGAPEAAMDLGKSASGGAPVLPFAVVILVLGVVAFGLDRRSRRGRDAADADTAAD
jgi:heat shock protein HslJ